MNQNPPYPTPGATGASPAETAATARQRPVAAAARRRELVAKDLTRRFGSVVAVDSVSLSLR